MGEVGRQCEELVPGDLAGMADRAVCVRTRGGTVCALHFRQAAGMEGLLTQCPQSSFEPPCMTPNQHAMVMPSACMERLKGGERGRDAHIKSSQERGH